MSSGTSKNVNIVASTVGRKRKIKNIGKSLVVIKICDTSDIIGPSDVGYIYPITAIAQGYAYTQRLGNNILIKSVSARFAILTTTVVHTDYVRIIVFNDRFSNGSTPAVSDVLDGNPAISILSTLNLSNKKRFKVIYDNMYGLDHATNKYVVDQFIRKVKLPISRFLDGTTSVTSMMSNMMYILFISGTNVNPPGIYFSSRIYFVDATL